MWIDGSLPGYAFTERFKRRKTSTLASLKFLTEHRYYLGTRKSTISVGKHGLSTCSGTWSSHRALRFALFGLANARLDFGCFKSTSVKDIYTHSSLSHDFTQSMDGIGRAERYAVTSLA